MEYKYIQILYRPRFIKRACDVTILKKYIVQEEQKKIFTEKYLAYGFETKFIYSSGVTTQTGQKISIKNNFSVILMNKAFEILKV